MFRFSIAVTLVATLAVLSFLPGEDEPAIEEVLWEEVCLYPVPLELEEETEEILHRDTVGVLLDSVPATGMHLAVDPSLTPEDLARWAESGGALLILMHLSLSEQGLIVRELLLRDSEGALRLDGERARALLREEGRLWFELPPLREGALAELFTPWRAEALRVAYLSLDGHAAVDLGALPDRE